MAITWENAAKIQVGMSLAEVEAILRGPARDESTGPLTDDDVADDEPAGFPVVLFALSPGALIKDPSEISPLMQIATFPVLDASERAQSAFFSLPRLAMQGHRHGSPVMRGDLSVAASAVASWCQLRPVVGVFGSAEDGSVLLSLKNQRLIDAVNMDDLKRMQEEGRPLDPKRREILLELHAKAELRKRLQPQPPVQPPQQAPASVRLSEGTEAFRCRHRARAGGPISSQ